MSNLTTTQMTVLTSACERNDGIATRPEALNRTAAMKVAAKLLERGFVQDVAAKSGWPVWRMGEDGKAFSLKILKPGRAVVKAGAKSVTPAAAAAPSPAARSTGAPADAKQSAQAKASALSAQPKAGSKRNLILAMMQRKDGATLGDLVAATGWLPHTTRAALTGLRKSGISIARSQDPQTACSVYRIEAAVSATAAA